VGNVPKLRFKGFVGEYNSYQLNELGEYGKSYPFSRAYEGEGDVHHIHYGDIHIKLPTIISDSSVLPSITEKRDFQYVQVGDIVIADASEDYKDLGKAVCINDDSHKVISGLHTHRFSPYQKTAISDYLVRYMQTERYRRFIYRMGTGVSVLGLSKANLSKFKLNLPVLEEQKKISFFFNELENRIERQQEKIELLKEQKKGYMQKIFNRELRFKDEYGKAFPESKEYNFADFLEIPLKEKEENPIKENLLTVKLHLKGIAVSENIATLKIGSTTYYKRKAGQFIYGKQNLFNGAFGIVPDYLDGYLSSGDIPTLDFHVDNIEPYYFFYYLSQRDIYKRLENISNGTGSKRIHEAELLKQKIKLPCIKEQQKIVQFLSSMDRKIDREEEKLVALQEQQKGFMQQMFI